MLRLICLLCNVQKEECLHQQDAGTIGTEGTISHSETDTAIYLRTSENSFQTISLSVN